MPWRGVGFWAVVAFGRKAAWLVCAAFGLAHCSASTPPAPLHWETDLPAACARAQAEGRAVLLDFRADWCGSCVRLEREIWPHAAVRTAAARFVLVRVDMTQQAPDTAAQAAAYGVQSLPTVVFIDAAGHVLEAPRLRTWLPPREVARMLRKVP